MKVLHELYAGVLAVRAKPIKPLARLATFVLKTKRVGRQFAEP